MKKGTRIGMILIWILLLASALGAMGFSETLIIEFGVVTYRSACTLLFALLGAWTLILAISLVKNSIRAGVERKQRATLEQERKEEEAARRAEESAKLSVSKKLDEHAMRRLLEDKARKEWQSLAPEIRICLKQMDRMNEYQERLSGLLDMNGVESLKDTEDMLDAVEQYTFRNIRKAINYMNVLDADSPSDQDKARDQLASCTEDNGQRLNQVQDFLLALADFLNRQGEGTQEIDMLQMYKDTILGSLQ